MTVSPAIAELVPDAQRWRRHLHAHPELLYDLDQTAAFVAERLREFGCDEVRTGVGRSGVVGVIKGRKGASGRAIGLRADMDALPIVETTNLPYRSTVPGRMHACGHDGHTAIMLGTARYLAATRDFAGSAVVIFQPAEEGGAGAKAMVDDGLMEDFAIEEVYALHNAPKLEVGKLAIRKGAAMASADFFVLKLEGKGGHAAFPHNCVDVIVAGAQIVTRAADDRFAQRRPARFLRRLGGALHRRQHRQHPAADRRTRRHRAHAVAGGARPRRAALPRDRRRNRRRFRRQRDARLPPQLSGDGQSGEADANSPPPSRARRSARTMCRPTSRR